MKKRKIPVATWSKTARAKRKATWARKRAEKAQLEEIQRTGTGVPIVIEPGERRPNIQLSTVPDGHRGPGRPAKVVIDEESDRRDIVKGMLAYLMAPLRRRT